MKHWEIKVLGDHIRAEWNESATFNMQSRSYDGQWVDYHCFTCYGIQTDHEALECIVELIKEELKEDELFWEYLEENPTEMKEAVVVL